MKGRPLARTAGPAPLPSSHPTAIASRIVVDVGGEALATLDEPGLWRLVMRYAGLPLVNGGTLHLSARRVKRTVALLRRPLPAPAAHGR